MGLAVVTVTAGGLPVVDVTAIAPMCGTPVTETANGRGIPVTKVVGRPGLPVVFETIGPPSAPVLTTFATFDGTPSAGVVMSNGNRTVTHGTSNNGTGNASTLALTAGKFYFEITLSGGVSVGEGIGIRVYVGGTFSEFTSFQTGLGVLPGATSNIYNANVNTTKNLGVAVDNDVFGFAIDLTARLGWIRRNAGTWNADAAANPATGANGLTIIAGSMSPCGKFTNTGPTNAFTGNFGQSAFAFPAPSGFSLGWGT